MNLEVTKLTEKERVYKDFLQDWFKLTLKTLKKTPGIRCADALLASELSIVFVDEKRIQELNKNYRGMNNPTDVLSFDGDGVVSLGELIFCMSIIKSKAQSLNLPSKVYLGMLLIHGVLHLLGYEHEQGGEKEAEMFRLQDQIVRKVASKLAPNHKTDFDVA